jgi:methionyl-tRNA formyltransferase
MRLLFAGTPGIALPALDTLHREGYIQAVLTSPDAPQGRSRKPVASPVKARALELGLPVLSPERLGQSVRDEIKELQPDLLAVVAYGRIFGPRFLQLFPGGGINLHPSLLPRHRGPAPLPAAILAGDEEWGITVQRIALEMDAGDVLIQERYPCTGHENTTGLTAEAGIRGAAAMLAAVKGIEQGTLTGTPQDHGAATYCGLIRKEDGLIDWSLTAEEIHRRVRAYDPWPGAYSFLEGRKLNVWEAGVLPDPGELGEPGKIRAVDKKEGILVQTGGGLLALRTLQLQGKKRLPWQSFVNGIHGIEGSTLGGTR